MVNWSGRVERLPSLPPPYSSPVCPAPAHPPAAAKQSEGGAGEPSWGEVLSSRAARIGVMLFLFQQFSGINAIVYFSSSGQRFAVLSGWRLLCLSQQSVEQQ